MSGTFDELKKLSSSYHESAAETDFAAFDKVVRSRRSIRAFDGHPIPDQVMRASLQHALLAPTSSNLQSTEFYWVRTPALRTVVNQICLSQPAATTASEVVVCVARLKTWKKNAKAILADMDSSGVPKGAPQRNYYAKLVPFVYEVGPFGLFAPLKWLLLNGRGLFTPTPREPVGRADLKLWAAKSAALACENFMLSMRAAGYDTCPMEGLDPARMKRALGLPRDAYIVMAIGCGKRVVGGVYGPQFRLPIADFIKEV
jgi:nitroreductase